MMEDIAPEEPVLVLEDDVQQERTPYFVAFEEIEQQLDESLQHGSKSFRNDNGQWYTRFGRVERTQALSIKPKRVPNRILVLPITQEQPEIHRAYFLNLYRNTKGKSITYISEYLMGNGGPMADFDIEHFTGKITDYTLEGEVLQELSFVNGEIAVAANARSCGYTWDPYTEIICSDPDELHCHTTYGYDLIATECADSPLDPVEIDESPWQGGGGTMPVYPLPITLWLKGIDSSQLDDCLKNVLNDLLSEKNAILWDILKDLTGADAKFGWQLTMNNSLQPHQSATTSPKPNSEGYFVTQMNGRALKNASDLSVARTLIHEAIHAHIGNQRSSNPYEFKGLFPLLLEYYTRTDMYNSAQHFQMANTFMNVIADGIYQFAQQKGYSHVDYQYAKDLAWGGLTNFDNGSETPWFLDMVKSSSDRKRIKDRIATEAMQKDSEGFPSRQKGGQTGC